MSEEVDYKDVPWEDWARGKGDWKDGCWCMPVYLQHTNEWMVYEPGGDIYAVVPNDLYTLKVVSQFKTRYNS